jgi:Ras-related protein Rab-1A
MFLVHYTGWNTRYDEWIPRTRIAENLSWTPARAKRSRLQQQQQQQQQAQQQPQQQSSQVKVTSKALYPPSCTTTFACLVCRLYS